MYSNKAAFDFVITLCGRVLLSFIMAFSTIFLQKQINIIEKNWTALMVAENLSCRMIEGAASQTIFQYNALKEHILTHLLLCLRTLEQNLLRVYVLVICFCFPIYLSEI